MTLSESAVNASKAAHRTAFEQKRIVNTWGVVALAVIALLIVGNVLASVGTTRTYFCLGSFVDCEAIQITPLGSFGIFLQWTMPLAALVATVIWWALRGIWKEEVAHEAAQARKAESLKGEAVEPAE